MPRRPRLLRRDRRRRQRLPRPHPRDRPRRGRQGGREPLAGFRDPAQRGARPRDAAPGCWRSTPTSASPRNWAGKSARWSTGPRARTWRRCRAGTSSSARRSAPRRAIPNYRHRLFRRARFRHDEARTVHEGLWPDGPTVALDGRPGPRPCLELERSARRCRRLRPPRRRRSGRGPTRARRRSGSSSARWSNSPTGPFLLGGCATAARGLLKIGLDCAADAGAQLLAIRRGRAAPPARPSARRRRGSARCESSAQRRPRAGAQRVGSLAGGRDGGRRRRLADRPATEPRICPAEALDGSGPGAFARALDAADQLRPVDAVLVAGRRERAWLRFAPGALRGTVPPLALGDDPATTTEALQESCRTASESRISDDLPWLSGGSRHSGPHRDSSESARRSIGTANGTNRLFPAHLGQQTLAADLRRRRGRRRLRRSPRRNPTSTKARRWARSSPPARPRAKSSAKNSCSRCPTSTANWRRRTPSSTSPTKTRRSKATSREFDEQRQRRAGSQGRRARLRRRNRRRADLGRHSPTPTPTRSSATSKNWKANSAPAWSRRWWKKSTK